MFEIFNLKMYQTQHHTPNVNKTTPLTQHTYPHIHAELVLLYYNIILLINTNHWDLYIGRKQATNEIHLIEFSHSNG